MNCIHSLSLDSLSSTSRCYQLNTDGEGAGNCGYSRGAFLPCDSEDVLCGQLQCQEGDFTRGDVAGSVTIYRTRFSRSEVCRSFSTNPDSDTNNPGLVQDGTRCGNGTVSQKPTPSLAS